MLHTTFRLLFIPLSVCFFVTAHSAPARATRPLLEASQGFKDALKAQTASLDEVLKGKKNGLSFETSSRQTEIRAQAKRFTTTRNANTFFEANCKTDADIQKNAFCLLENDRRQARELSSENAIESSEKVNIADLRNGEVEKLSKFSLSSLTKGLSEFDSPNDFEKLVTRLTQGKTCYNSALYVATAAKVEEFFPEPEQIKKAKALYEKAAGCTNDEMGMRARYRYSLLQIWQNSCEKVDQFLAEVEADPTASAYHSRSRYWRHQCAVRTGTKEVRVATEQALLKNHPLSFHTLSIDSDNEQFNELLSKQEPVKVMFRSVVRPDLNLRIAGIEALLAQNSYGWAGDFLDRISSQLTGSEPEFRLYTATLAERSGNSIAKFKILSALFDDSPKMLQAATLKMYFPLSYFSAVQLRAAKAVDPYLILSLIRQESAFNKMARSPVGARGLMQVMPATARSISAVSSRRLFDPQTNIQVGTKYFIHRLNQFNGDVGLTLAAYNAGATRVDRWVKRYAGADKILFMDLIPYRETRDYVASILRNHYWYTRLYEKKALTKNLTTRRS